MEEKEKVDSQEQVIDTVNDAETPVEANEGTVTNETSEMEQTPGQTGEVEGQAENEEIQTTFDSEFYTESVNDAEVEVEEVI